MRQTTPIHGGRADREISELERMHALEKPTLTRSENNVFYFLLIIIILQAASWAFWLEALR